MARGIWLRVFVDDRSMPAALARSAGPDFEIVPYTPGSGGPGLVCFGSPDPQLLDFVTRASCGGREIVLALSLLPCSPDEVRGLLGAGATDVLPATLLERSGEALRARLKRAQAIETLLADPAVVARLVGASPAWRRAAARLVEAARFTDAAILLTGESGTGKELAARLVHELGQDAGRGAFVVVDCTTIVPELSGSEFFGHERGAFTGALAQRDGAFAQADGGTLFLDEIGELPLPLQAQLLRVIQEGTFKRVGGNTWYNTRFRLVSATHRDLARRVRDGAFRADLYFRIAAVPIDLPPLRERRADIMPLARHFIAEACGHRDAPELDPVVEKVLVQRDYPGNVRELRQLVARLVYRWPGAGPLTPGCVPDGDWPELPDEVAPACTDGPSGADGLADVVRALLAAGLGLREIGRRAEETAFRLVMDDEAQNVQRAARRLGVTDRALQLRCQSERRRGGNGAAG